MCIKTSIVAVAVGEEDGEIIEAEVGVTEKNHTPGLQVRIGKMTMER